MLFHDIELAGFDAERQAQPGSVQIHQRVSNGLRTDLSLTFIRRPTEVGRQTTPGVGLPIHAGCVRVAQRAAERQRDSGAQQDEARGGSSHVQERILKAGGYVDSRTVIVLVTGPPRCGMG